MWTNNRNLPSQLARAQTAAMQASMQASLQQSSMQQPQQEEMFAAQAQASRLGAQGSFRFGNVQQTTPQPVHPSQQAQQAQQAQPAQQQSLPPQSQASSSVATPLGQANGPEVAPTPTGKSQATEGQDRGANQLHSRFAAYMNSHTGSRHVVEPAMPNGHMGTISAINPFGNHEPRSATALGPPGELAH